MKSFWDSTTPLDVWLYIVGLLLVVFILGMEFMGRPVDTLIWGMLGIVFTLITGKQIPTPSEANLLKAAMQKTNQ